MGFFATLLILLFLLYFLGPLLRRFVMPLFQRWMMGKMEDNMRRMAGMPTRKEEKKARKKNSGGRRNVSREWEEAVKRSKKENAVDYMRSYAEDVEFEEIKTKEKH